jgi:hypothetical protein
MPMGLHSGLHLFRNNDQEMERVLSKVSSERRIPVKMGLRATSTGFELNIDDAVAAIETTHQQAEKPQRENIIRQLTKLGGTPFECTDIDLPAGFNYFIPAVNWPNCAAVRLRYDFPTKNPPQHPQWFAVSPQTACHSIPYPIYIMWPMMTPVLSTSNRASPRPRPSNNSHPMSPCLCSAAIVYAMPWVTARSWAGKKLSGTNRFFCAWAMVTASGWNSTVGNVK